MDIKVNANNYVDTLSINSIHMYYICRSAVTFGNIPKFLLAYLRLFNIG